MPRDTQHESLDFLQADPEPVAAQPQSNEMTPDTLPQATIDELMRLDGVDGVWIERDDAGRDIVVLHYSRPGSPGHLPSRVLGKPTRVVGGEPIRAQPRPRT